MKNIGYIMVAVVAMVLVGCGTEKIPTPDNATGQVSLNLTKNGEYIVQVKGEPAVEEFAVNIKDGSGGTYKSYGSYAEVPEMLDLPEGKYTMEASNGTLQQAAFDAPYYFGSTSFSVKTGQHTEAKIEALLANLKMTLVYSERFKANVTQADIVVANSGGGSLPFTVEEQRAGYFAPPAAGKKMTISVKGFNKVSNSSVSGSLEISNAQAREWYKVTVDIALTGNAAHNVIINSELIEKDIDINIPGGDDIVDNGGDDGVWPEEPENPDPTPDPDPEPVAPTIVGQSFNGTPFTLDQELAIGQAGAGAVIDVALNATNGGIKNLFLTIESESLAEVLAMMGIVGKIDLANPPVDAAWAELFASKDIGLLPEAGQPPIAGKNSHLFSVGGLMSMLGAVQANNEEVHSFVLEVVDNNGETVTATLRIRLTK